MSHSEDIAIFRSTDRQTNIQTDWHTIKNKKLGAVTLLNHVDSKSHSQVIAIFRKVVTDRQTDQPTNQQTDLGW